MRIGDSIDAYGGYAPATQAACRAETAAQVSITGSNVSTEDISTTGGSSARPSRAHRRRSRSPPTAKLRTLGGARCTSGQDGASGTAATPGVRAGAQRIRAPDDRRTGRCERRPERRRRGDCADGRRRGHRPAQREEGGGGSNAIPSGGPGGVIRVSAPDGATLGKVLAYGGQSSGGTAGRGGTITVTSSAGSISSRRRRPRAGTSTAARAQQVARSRCPRRRTSASGQTWTRTAPTPMHLRPTRR